MRGQGRKWRSDRKEVDIMQKRMFMTIVKLDGKRRTVKAAGTAVLPDKRKGPAAAGPNQNK